MRSLSTAALRAILAHLRDEPAKIPKASLAGEIERALQPRRSVVKAAVRRKERTNAVRRGLDAVREAVKARSMAANDGDLCCENCGTIADHAGSLEHFFGGADRASRQSSRTCWWLGWVCCHLDKTNNKPSAEYWLKRFREHALRHGYSGSVALVDKRLARLELEKQLPHGRDA